MNSTRARDGEQELGSKHNVNNENFQCSMFHKIENLEI